MPISPPTIRNVPVPANVPAAYGLVLMGGQSSRMGQDKSALIYHGNPQREHLTSLLQPLCPAVYWSVNAQQHRELTYGRMLPDTYPEAGPMGGLLTAFETYPDRAWLSVPCDLPYLDGLTLGTLLANRQSDRVATAFYKADRSGPEPLVCLWEPAAGPLLRTWFAAGRRSPFNFLTTYPTALLDAPDPAVFTNVNDRPGFLAVTGEEGRSR